MGFKHVESSPQTRSSYGATTGGNAVPIAMKERWQHSRRDRQHKRVDSSGEERSKSSSSLILGGKRVRFAGN